MSSDRPIIDSVPIPRFFHNVAACIGTFGRAIKWTKDEILVYTHLAQSVMLLGHPCCVDSNSEISASCWDVSTDQVAAILDRFEELGIVKPEAIAEGRPYAPRIIWVLTCLRPDFADDLKTEDDAI